MLLKAFLGNASQGSVGAEIHVDSETLGVDFLCLLCVHLGIDDSTSIKLGNVLVERSGQWVPLSTSKDNFCVGDLDLKEGDKIVLRREEPAPARATNNQPKPSEMSIPSLRYLPNFQNPDDLHAALRANPHLIQELTHHNAKLAEAAKKESPSELRAVLIQQQLDKSLAEHQRNELHRRAMMNPFDVEAQRAIEREIEQKNVNENMEMAMEASPESFGSVVMLYINVEVNGKKIKAFVDSGAQSTIMSESCAKDCGLMRLIDRRFAGRAVGVGSAKIVGRVHLAPLKIGNTHYNCTFTVLEDGLGDRNMKFLFGLDMLKRHQCMIDLKNNCLHLNGANGSQSVKFLSESEVPMHARLTQAEDKKTPSSAQSSAAPATPPVAPPSSSGTFAEKDVQRLIEMGFPRQRVLDVLKSCNGDVETAITCLMFPM